jgi:hypothetical protein
MISRKFIGKEFRVPNEMRRVGMISMLTLLAAGFYMMTVKPDLFGSLLTIAIAIILGLALALPMPRHKRAQEGPAD